jgi:hypothetical protein
MNLLNLLIITGMQIGDLDLNHQPLQPNESTCQKAGVIGYIYLFTMGYGLNRVLF